MKLAILIFFFVSFVVGTSAFVFGDDFASYPYFAKIEGAWKGDGTITGADGEETLLHEEWEAKRNDEGGFSITGDRKMGDVSQQFRWDFFLNTATELIECEYWHTGMNEPTRLTPQFLDEGINLQSSLGGAELVIQNRWEGGKLVAEFSLQGADGQTIFTGKVTHTKNN